MEGASALGPARRFAQLINAHDQKIRTAAAKELDGYVGAKPPGFKCPKED